MRKSEAMIAAVEVIKECLRYGLIAEDEAGRIQATELGRQQHGRWKEYVDWVKRTEQALKNEHGVSLKEVE